MLDVLGGRCERGERWKWRNEDRQWRAMIGGVTAAVMKANDHSQGRKRTCKRREQTPGWLREEHKARSDTLKENREVATKADKR